MKRILTSILMIAIMLTFSVSCFAASDTLTNDKLSASHAVCAKFSCDYSKLEDHTTGADADGDGFYSATTAGGLKVEVSSDEKGKTLVVHEITERDQNAAKWFKKQFAGMKNISPLEIFLVDESGSPLGLPAGTLVTLSNMKEGQQLIALTSDGKKTIVAGEFKNGVFVFRAVDADYYVVCTPADKKPEDKPILPEVGPDAKPPKTADRTPLTAMVALMLLSIAGIILVRKKLKKA